MSERLTNRDRQTDPLEQTLDLALASYTPGRPRLGLEERVRARIAVAGPIQRRTRLPLLWMGAVAAAAVLAAAVLLLVMLRSHTQPTPDKPHRRSNRAAGPNGSHPRRASSASLFTRLQQAAAQGTAKTSSDAPPAHPGATDRPVACQWT